LTQVVTAHGLTALDARRKFGFAAAGSDPDQALSDPSTHLVCIATRHDLHADLVVRALRSGKHVFVEKPLAINDEQLGDVEREAASAPGLLLVGFNRRFSPMARGVREALAGRGPIMMTYRVNAGALPHGHWLNDPLVGGGRFVGEGCHFVDFLSHVTGDPGIVSIQAECAGRRRGPTEDLVVQIAFADGSLGQILYTAKGEATLGKERFEGHAGGVSAVIDDYRECRIYRARTITRVKPPGKGHPEEIATLVEAARKGGPSPIPLATLVEVTRATLDGNRALVAGDNEARAQSDSGRRPTPPPPR
jgi:predicted dehydrogenase